jgi:hypothetical protein
VAEEFGLITEIDRWVTGRGIEIAATGLAVEPTDRPPFIGRAATILGSEAPEGGVADRQGRRASSPVPVFGQGRVVGRRPARDDRVSGDGRPGELVEIGAALAVAEHPPALPGLVEPIEVPGDDLGSRLVRMAESCHS